MIKTMFLLILTLRENVQIRSQFCSVFSCIQSKYEKIRTRNSSVFGHFSRSVGICGKPLRIHQLYNSFRILRRQNSRWQKKFSRHLHFLNNFWKQTDCIKKLFCTLECHMGYLNYIYSKSFVLPSHYALFAPLCNKSCPDL